MLRARVGDGAHVQHQGPPCHRGEVAGDRRPIDAADPSQLQQSAGHHRAAVAGRDQRVGAAITDGIERDGDRRARFAAHRLRRLFIPPDGLRGVCDHDVDPGDVLARQRAPDLRFRAGQQEIDPEASRPVHGPHDDDRRSVVPASRVNGDAHGLLLE